MTKARPSRQSQGMFMQCDCCRPVLGSSAAACLSGLFYDRQRQAKASKGTKRKEKKRKLSACSPVSENRPNHKNPLLRSTLGLCSVLIKPEKQSRARANCTRERPCIVDTFFSFLLAAVVRPPGPEKPHRQTEKERASKGERASASRTLN